MKKLICLFLITLLLGACAPVYALAPAPLSPDGCEGFSLALAARLIDGAENSSLSPVSVYIALAMAAEGARGETQNALLRVLRAESPEDLRARCKALLDALSVDTGDSVLALADAFWVDDKGGRLPFDPAYLEALSEVYRSEAGTADFSDPEAGAAIAAWIREKTRGKIDISPDAMEFSPETGAVLVNTIYLKDAWAKGFEASMTKPGTFYGPQGELNVNYMHRTDREAFITRGEGFTRSSVLYVEDSALDTIYVDSDMLVALPGLLQRLEAGSAVSVAQEAADGTVLSRTPAVTCELR